MEKLDRAGRALIASGVMGLLAFASLFAALYTRKTTASQEQWAAGVIQPGIWDTLFRGHDVVLILVAVANAGIVLALGPSVLALVGPVPSQVDPVGVRSALNAWSHLCLDIGTVLGVLTLPAWSILAGRGIARAASAAAAD